MNKEYYKEYYTIEREHWWFKIRAQIIEDNLKSLNLPKDCKILNVGAATFRTSELLRNYGNVESLEYDKDCCEFVDKVLKEKITNGSATNLPYTDNEFDLVCAFDVIEHIQDDSKAISEFKRVLKDGSGIIFLTVPAFMFLWSEHDIINQHYRRYKIKNLTELIISNKIAVIKNFYFNSLLFPFISIARVLSRIKKSKTNQSDFQKYDTSRQISKCLEFIFSLEKTLLKFVKFPFGVSILLIAKINRK